MSEFDTQENLLSLHFGRTFWLNEEGEFCSAPTFKNGKTHWEQWDYVSDWIWKEWILINSLMFIEL